LTHVLDLPRDAVLMPIGRFEWERLVRRIVMPPQHKLVALLLATWADADGSRVRPGLELLAAAIGRSERTAANALRSLCRDWGLLEQMTRGGGRGRSGRAADYRLTIPTDLLDRHVLLGPNGLPERPEAQVSSQSVDSPVDNSGDGTDPLETLASAQSNGRAPDDHEIGDAPDRLTGSFQRLTGSPAFPTTNHITNHPQTTQPSELHTQPPEGSESSVDNSQRSPPRPGSRRRSRSRSPTTRR
jgi:hypothetical protein